MTLDPNTIRAAHKRICAHIHRTPVLTSTRLDEASGAHLFLKCENFQKVGAFKARGATNAVFSLDEATAKLGAFLVSPSKAPSMLARTEREISRTAS